MRIAISERIKHPIMFLARLENVDKKSLVLWAIAISFILKMVIGYFLQDSFFSRGNSHTALNALAFSILHDHAYSLAKGIQSIDYEPLYPLFLALNYKLFGTTWFGVTLSQAVLFGLTSWLIFLIGKTVYDELAGTVAAIYHSFYPALFFYSLSVIDITIFIFIIMLLTYLLVKNNKRPSFFFNNVLFGCVSGIALLTRGSAVAILPPMILYAFFRSSGSGKFKGVSTILIAALIILSPWLMRNYLHTHTLLISTHGAFGLWQGNNPNSLELIKKNMSLDEVYRQEPPPALYQKYPNIPRPPREAVQAAKEYKDAAVQFILKHPAKFIELAWFKLLKFWSWTYNPVMSKYAYSNVVTRQWLYFLSYVPLLLCMPFGLFYLFRKFYGLFLFFAGVLLTYTAAHMVAMGFSRLRMPLDTYLMIFFGIIVSYFFKKQIDSLLKRP